MKHADPDHTVRRLEAFSDIVIAFTLSQLAFTLQIPHSTRDLFAHPAHVLVFLGSFVFVCSFWWLHHQIFARLFYPDTPGILLNFAFLAAAVFVAYSMLLVTKVGDLQALGVYALSLGSAYVLLAILFGRGARDSRLVIDAETRRSAWERALRLGIGGTVMLASFALVLLGRTPEEITGVWLVSVALIILLALRDRIARRRRER
ncbi:MAG TPA: TMEM175 family protein, partial [Candidatus Eremiobacteraceae bacterium]|nr:TMEM175 family protein [Candidatus Eremiobacteraceae bacterium]